MHIYEKVTATGLPNYIMTHCHLPSNLQVKEWEALIYNADDAAMVNCLKLV